jgi:hypothetical protein
MADSEEGNANFPAIAIHTTFNIYAHSRGTFIQNSKLRMMIK